MRCDAPASCHGSGLFTTSPFPDGSRAIHACQCHAGRKFGKKGDVVGYTAASFGSAVFSPHRGYATLLGFCNSFASIVAPSPRLAESKIKGWTGDGLKQRLTEGAEIGNRERKHGRFSKKRRSA